jgi:fatty acid desaturase
MYLNSLPAFRFGEHERLLHRDHHTFTGITGKDTELVEWGEMVFKNGFRKVPESVTEYWWMFASLTWSTALSKARKLVHCARGHPVDYTCTDWTIDRDVNDGNPSIKDTLQKWARAHLSFYIVFIPLCVYTAGLKLMFWCWLLPCFFGPALTWILQIAEHADCTRDGNGLTNTRTLEVPGFVRFVYWNMNYHAEHHLYPMFPFHHLPEAHELLQGHLTKSSDSIFEIHKKVITEYIPKQEADEPVTGEPS